MELARGMSFKSIDVYIDSWQQLVVCILVSHLYCVESYQDVIFIMNSKGSSNEIYTPTLNHFKGIREWMVSSVWRLEMSNM